MKYIAIGASLVNNLVFPDGKRQDNVLGGCGFYAYSGLRFYEKDSLFMSVVGADYGDYYGSWLDKNGISREGFQIDGPYTRNTILTYLPNGDYTEVPARTGERMGNLKAAMRTLSVQDIEKHLGADTTGVYLFGQWQRHIEGAYDAVKKAGAKVMWEVTPVTYLGITEYYDEFMDYLGKCDIYSLNRFEAFVIFGVDSDEAVIERIKAIGKPCYYRIGTEGAYMVTKDECVLMPMISVVPREQEVDPTGCGNSSTAAAMWAWCEGYDPLMTAILAGVAAAYNVRQYGPWQDMSDEVREEALAEAQKIYSQYKKV